MLVRITAALNFRLFLIFFFTEFIVRIVWKEIASVELCCQDSLLLQVN